MTTLKAVVASLDEVEERLRDHYVEVDGQFVLDSDVENAPEVGNLKRAHDRVVAEHEALIAEKNRIEGVLAAINASEDPDAIRRALREGKKAKGDPEAALRRSLQASMEIEGLRSALAQELREAEEAGAALIAAKDETIKRMKEFTRRRTIETRLRNQLLHQYVKREMIEAALSLLMERHEFIVDEDKIDKHSQRPDVRVKTAFGEKPIAFFVRDWTRAGEGVAFVDWKRAKEAPPVQQFDPRAIGPMSAPSVADQIRKLR